MQGIYGELRYFYDMNVKVETLEQPLINTHDNDLDTKLNNILLKMRGY